MCVFFGKALNPVIYHPFPDEHCNLGSIPSLSETPIVWLDWPFQCFRSRHLLARPQERPDFHLLLRMDESKFHPYSYQLPAEGGCTMMHLHACNWVKAEQLHAVVFLHVFLAIPTWSDEYWEPSFCSDDLKKRRCWGTLFQPLSMRPWRMTIV